MTSQQIKLLEEISKAAVQSDWELAFNGKSRGNRHLFRVNKIASFLQQHEGGDEFIVLATAWVHDVSLALGNDDNSEKIYDYTLNFLQQFSIDEVTCKEIANAASSHEVSLTTKLESQIVHDADVMDKSGLLGVIRQIWKKTNLIDKRILCTPEDLLSLQQSLTMRQEKLFTKTAKELFANLSSLQSLFFDDPLAIQFMERISKMAENGIISDEIVKVLVREQPDSDISNRLLGQVNCLYLKSP